MDSSKISSVAKISTKSNFAIPYWNARLTFSKPTFLVFMGVFHCNWMNNVGSETSNLYYYITKSYKGK